MTQRKKVLLIVVDALTPEVLRIGMEAGKFPNFSELAERGVLREDCCSVFPSITHACLSSIATGEYPIEHRILGTFWYEKDRNEIAYYGAQPWVVLNQGLNKFLEDLIFKWNEERLACRTMFEIVEDAGLQAACLNHLVYRGRKEYKVHQPLLMKLVPGVETSGHLHGPSIMFLGDFVRPVLPGREKPINVFGGPKHRFGMDDESTLSALGGLAAGKAFQDLTVAYFPDNDVLSHSNGPKGARMALKKIDAGLGELFKLMGGIDQVLSEFTIIIHGDHAQVPMKDGEDHGGICLDEILDEFDVVDAGEILDGQHELLLAPNLRSAYVYCDECTPEKHARIADLLLQDERVDQVIWQADVICPGDRGFWVRTADRGKLHFWQSDSDEDTAKDDYGCCWAWEGDLEALDAKVEHGRIKWGDYPNAFERIACGVGPANSGHLVATARLGHGFRMEGIKAHAGGGSHASLHRGDSYTALIVAGVPDGVAVADHFRIVDTLSLIRDCLQIEGGRPQGQPRFFEPMKEPVT